ncbi:DUF4276 family protein [Helicobacter macacae]|uniref:DUF4276 family protein n=1 Tax=Helicobacter macacae MIT 99-5501 TaxID=1357400 RepID=V8C7H7_9HELI|nr:DUF4276 family protein [Helicobacter macacae]ETD22701.1 hypothetical protein HMPREF2086_01500 [Helicobacter macacae MIT 99-5501]
MKRVYILCEGQSEEVFIRQVLAPYFININSQHCLIPIVTKTSAGHKGGGLKYHRIKKEILALLNHKEAFVSTFFDYYALPNDFPKYDKQNGDIYEKVAILEQGFYEDINDSDDCYQRFFPHIQPYEFESLLFSDIDKIIQADTEWSNNKSYFIGLKAIIDEFNNPELINNSLQTSPSHRLKNILPTYRKVLHGKIITEKITITHIREKCSHFNEWCKKIASL